MEDGDKRDETDEEQQVRLQAEKLKLKEERDKAEIIKGESVFKHLFRSKGFIWLANTPGVFFEWSQAAINL